MLKELIEKRKMLDVQITVAKAVERTKAINTITELCREWGIDPKALPKNLLPMPKFYNTETGETWTGRGRAPDWAKTDKAAHI